MASVKFAAPVSGLRGKLGGIVFSANSSSNYCKPWARGAVRHTALTSVQRRTLGTHAIAWRSLSAANAATWNVYAADVTNELTNSLGVAYYASGFNWFVGINQNRINLGLAQLDTAPATGVPAAPTVVLASCSASPNAALGLTWGAGEFTTLYGRVYVSLSPPGNNAVPPISRYTYYALIPLGGAPGFIIGGYLDYITGPVLADSVVFVRTNAITSAGRMGPGAYDSIIAV